MTTKLSPSTVRTFVESNPKLVRVKWSERRPGYGVLKYSAETFYSAAWNPILMMCRGALIDRDYNLIGFPFPKIIFNRREPGLDGKPTDIQRDEMVKAVRKVNGFMAAATFVPEIDDVIVNTTGTIDSSYVTIAEDLISSKIRELIKKRYVRDGARRTYMFEIVDRRDTIAHPIEEFPGLYYLSQYEFYDWDNGRVIPFGAESHMKVADELGARCPTIVEQVRYSDLVASLSRCKHEGWVVYGRDTILKLKSPHYLTTKFLGRIKPEKLKLKLENPEQLKRDLADEEFFPVVDYLVSIKDVFLDELTPDSARMQLVRDFLLKQSVST